MRTRLISPLLAALLLALPASLFAGDESTDSGSEEEGEAGEAGDEGSDGEAPPEGDGEPEPEGESEEAGEAAGAEAAAEPETETEDEAAEAPAPDGEAAPAGDSADAGDSAAAEEPAAEEAEAGEAEEEADDGKPAVTLSAEAGFLWLAGNTKAITVNGGVDFGVSHDRNQFALGVGGAYGRGVAAGDATNTWVVTATRVFGGLRYDRFFLPDINSLYLGGGASHDPFAGFALRIEANVGYGHVLVTTPIHRLALEGGFNYSRDEFVEGVLPESQNLVGGRVFVGYGLTPHPNFGFGQSVEAVLGGTDNAEQRFDGRLQSSTELTANISKVFGLKVGFVLNWDFQPPEGFEALDTTTSVTLVATIL